jgi:hypothetical protein
MLPQANPVSTLRDLFASKMPYDSWPMTSIRIEYVDMMLGTPKVRVNKDVNKAKFCFTWGYLSFERKTGGGTPPPIYITLRYNLLFAHGKVRSPVTDGTAVLSQVIDPSRSALRSVSDKLHFVTSNTIRCKYRKEWAMSPAYPNSLSTLPGAPRNFSFLFQEM